MLATCTLVTVGYTVFQAAILFRSHEEASQEIIQEGIIKQKIYIRILKFFLLFREKIIDSHSQV